MLVKGSSCCTTRKEAGNNHKFKKDTPVKFPFPKGIFIKKQLGQFNTQVGKDAGKMRCTHDG